MNVNIYIYNAVVIRFFSTLTNTWISFPLTVSLRWYGSVSFTRWADRSLQDQQCSTAQGDEGKLRDATGFLPVGSDEIGNVR